MSDSTRGERLIFVGGVPRSGTTLLQNMLDSHPDICGGPEFLHLPDIIHLRQKLHRSITREWIDFICSEEEVDDHIASLIENLLLPLADKNDCQFLSEKTPENILVFAELMELFPKAHFLHVVRDPRAIISSLLQVGVRAKEKGEKPPGDASSIQAAIRKTKKCISAGLKATNFAPERVFTVGYERLVNDPETETRRICQFLKIEWCAQLLHPEEFKHLGEKAITTMSDEIWYDKETYYSAPHNANIDKWKDQLTPIQESMIAIAFKEFEENLSLLGYDLPTDRLSIKDSVLGSTYKTLTHLSTTLSRVLVVCNKLWKVPT